MYHTKFRHSLMHKPKSNIPSIVLIISGIIIVAYWMPIWVWLVILGLILIVTGAALYK